MAVNNENETKDSGLLSSKKNKRLEEALSSYSPEKTKQAVGRLLEEYIDEGGKNYFGNSRRNTTLYFDDDYVTEVKKQSSQSKAPAAEKPKPKKEEPVIDEQNEEESYSDLGNTTIYEPVNHEAAEENAEEDADIEPDEEEVGPRRRRAAEAKKEKQAKKKKKPEPEPEPEIEEEYDDDYDEEDYDEEDYEDFDDEDYDEDFESVKKKKFFGFFRKNKDDDFDDDDDDDDDDDEYEDEDEDEYDDDEYDDDDYDYDDYDERGSVPVKKIFNIIFIILLICVIAVLAAMCINYKNLYESADKQVNQNISEQESSEIQSELESLRTENEALKADVERYKGSGVVPGNTESASEETSKSATGTAAMTPDQADAVSNGSSDSSTPQGNAYTVKSGDTAQKITIGVYGEYTPELWEKLKKANGKGDTDWIAGEEVKVP